MNGSVASGWGKAKSPGDPEETVEALPVPWYQALVISTALHKFVAISHVKETFQAPPHVEDMTCGHIGSRQISILMRYLKA